MSVEWALRVREGMLVVDNASDRVGTVKRAHSDEGLSESTADYLEVRSGLLGWGKDLYIPVSAIHHITTDAVYLAVDRDDIARLGWTTPPATNLGVERPVYGRHAEPHNVPDGALVDREARPLSRPLDDGEARLRTEAETLQLHGEELVAHKQTVETGAVTVTKEVVREEQTLEVPVTREEVYIDRQPVDPHPVDDVVFAGDHETIRVPVRMEQVEIEKRLVVREEVHIGKRPVQDTERISDTVRREELRVEEEGDVHVRSNPVDGPHWNP